MESDLPLIDESNISHIQQYFGNKTIFLTGGTGFVGKVLIEKFLRSCNTFDKLYLLIRPKKNQNIIQRIDGMLEMKLFDKIFARNDFAEESPLLSVDEAKLKILPIHGDILEEKLGISEADRLMLIEEVNVIIHSAATVRFDEPLKFAIRMNIKGVYQMIQLAKEMKKLFVFVHISTAYANCDRSHIDERIYQPRIGCTSLIKKKLIHFNEENEISGQKIHFKNDSALKHYSKNFVCPTELFPSSSTVTPQQLIDISEWMDDDTMNSIQSYLLGDRPNTYTFTKSVAEYYLAFEAENLRAPIAIVRPSIIGATWREPFPGWVDNFNGPSGLFVALGTGVLRSMLGGRELVADILPVDIISNMTIAVAWYISMKKPRKPIVFNCTSGQIKPFTWKMMELAALKTYEEFPLENVVMVPNPKFTRSRLVHSIRYAIEQQLPSYIFDMLLQLMGRKPKFMRIQTRLARAIQSLQYFTSHEWCFVNQNAQRLHEELSGFDKQMFNFNLMSMNWKIYMKDYCLGCKKFLLKEDINNVGGSISNLKKLKFIRFLFRCTIGAFWFYYLFRSTGIGNRVLYLTLQTICKLYQITRQLFL
ncbi:hypothetical protein SNEBB_005768 [Seison nebaliae]|nr:hypothetical protein SNEBB_005768 [Seison nebaliae]